MTLRPVPAQQLSPAHGSLVMARVVRGLAALAALVLLVGAVPVVLATIAPLHWPGRFPTGTQVLDVATRPDDGHLFLTALSLVAWGGWVAFTAGALLESLARVRGLPVVRIRGFGVPQRAAASLVTAVAVMLSSAAVAVPVDQPRPPVTASAPLDVMRVADTSRPEDLPTVLVRRGDTLWGLAERHLGSGGRFAEIARLNYGRSQPDGGQLTSSHWIRPGWILLLPADASVTVSPGPALAPSRAPALGDPAATTVVVQPGDTLWTIARTDLRDPTRYPEIVALNAGVLQPDGRALTDPNQIQPGWSLRLPPVGGVPSQPAAPSPAPRAPSPGPTATSPAPTASGPSITASAAPPAPSVSPTASARAAASSTADEHPPLPFLALGLGGLAAAGLVQELRRRRRQQQRHRRAGQRIPGPAPDPGSVERTLRAAHTPDTATFLRVAIAALMAACDRAERDLPLVGAVLVASNTLDFVLTEDDPQPVAGFHLNGPRTWRYGGPAASLTDAGSGQSIEDRPNPYPALVTVGATAEALVLINLEAAGVLTVAGAAEQVAQVERALAVELVTSPVSQDAWVLLGSGLAELAGVVDVARAQATTDGAEVAVDVRSYRDEVTRVLADANADDVLQARSRLVTVDLLTPHIYMDPDVQMSAQPWSGLAVVTTATGWAGSSSASPWTLTVTGDCTARLEPLGLDLTAQHLDDDTYQRVLDLLATATSTPAAIEPNPVTAPADRVALRAVPSAPLPMDPSGTVLDAGTSAEDLSSGEAPRVLVLGPVQIEGAHDDLVPNRRRRLTEFVTYLALHPGATYHQVDEAMWPGARVSTATRNALVSRARRWLGTTPAGEPYVAIVATDGDYRLHPDVTCDWHDFLRLAPSGLTMADGGPDLLARALQLVRARPFVGVDPHDYAWAEADTQEMISTIVDVAHALAGLRLAAGDVRGAQDAAARGLLAEPCSEMLHRDALRAAAARGDRAEITRLADRLHAQIQRLEPGGVPEDETVELLRTLGYRRS